jgi:DnaK suppressor protein
MASRAKRRMVFLEASMDADKLKRVEARLNALRAEILLEKEQAEEGTAPVELDQARFGRLARMDEMQQQAMAQELDRRRDTQLKRIEGTFLRLEKGTYGDCARCNAAIDGKRLDFDPTVFLCIACAESAQKR